jgi:predicted negative regulator of RcsB-dependent stress response
VWQTRSKRGEQVAKGGHSEPAINPLSDDVVFLLTAAVAQLRLALNLVDRSGHDVASAQLQMAIDVIAISLLKQPHDND